MVITTSDKLDTGDKVEVISDGKKFVGKVTELQGTGEKLVLAVRTVPKAEQEERKRKRRRRSSGVTTVSKIQDEPSMEQIVVTEIKSGKEQTFQGKLVKFPSGETRLLATRTVQTEEQKERERQRAVEEARLGLISDPKKRKKFIEEQEEKKIVFKPTESAEQFLEELPTRQALPVFSALQRATGATVTIRRVKKAEEVPRIVSKFPSSPLKRATEKITQPIDFSKVPILGGLQRNIQIFGEFKESRARQRLRQLEQRKDLPATLGKIIAQSDLQVATNIQQLSEDIRKPSTVLTVGAFKAVDKILGAIPKVGRFARGGFGIGVGTLFVAGETTQIIAGEKTVGESLGTLEAFLFFDAAFSAANRAVSNRLKRLGKKVEPAKDVFDIEVLTGKETFPTVKSLPEALAEFGKVKGPEGFEVVTATASPFRKVTTIKPGPKGKAGLEDPGLFVAPRGRGSPAFLRLPEFRVPEAKTEFALFPEPSKPQVIEFRNIQNIGRLPRSVREAPGFEPVREFFQGQPEAFITKRSEIGLGTAPRLPFEATKGFKAPIPRSIVRDGKLIVIPKGGKILKGDILTPGGTGELEAVIPPQKIVEVSNKRVTEFLNTIIPIREFRLTGEPTAKGEIPESFSKIFKETRKGQSSLESLISGSRIVTPSTIFPAFSFPSSLISLQPSAISKPQSQLQASIISDFSRISEPSVLISEAELSKSISKLSSNISVSASQLSKSISVSTVQKSVSQSASEISKSISRTQSRLRSSLASNLGRSKPDDLFSQLVKPLRRVKKKGRKEFNAFALIGATGKSPRFLKLNKKPLPKLEALLLSQRVVDNTVSARGKIAKKGSKQDTTKFTPLRKRKRKVEATRPNIDPFAKFRNFQIFNGKPIKLKKGEFIENTNFRINTLGELQGITVKGLLKQREQRKKRNSFRLF